MNTPRPTRNLLLVYAVMLRGDTHEHYALDLGRAADVPVGTIYALMKRLETAGLVTGRWEDLNPKDAGRPGRR